MRDAMIAQQVPCPCTDTKAAGALQLHVHDCLISHLEVVVAGQCAHGVLESFVIQDAVRDLQSR